MIRALLPVDVPAVIYFYSKAPVNQAKPRESLGREQLTLPPLAPLPAEWLPSWGRRHYGLALFHHGLVYSLVSARSCWGPSAWEVDRLMLSEEPYEIGLVQRAASILGLLKLGRLLPDMSFTGQIEEFSAELLQRLSEKLGHIGASKLFLRLPSDSPLLEFAIHVGFSQYMTESLYRFEGSKLTPSPPPFFLRPRSEADEYELFQLYSKTAPAAVRRAEGLTFQEWRQTREQLNDEELIYEDGGRLCALLRIRSDDAVGQFQILAAPDTTELRDLIEWSLSLLDEQWPILCLAPDFQTRLQRALQNSGFAPVARFRRLVKQIPAPAYELKLAPQQA